MQDLISRQAAIDIAKNLIVQMNEYHQYNQAINNYCAELVQLPPAQPERKKGKWFYNPPMYDCDQCGAEFYDPSPWCPMCGAYMGDNQNEIN